ncbi:MAG: carboxypeptidase regulatory-like domain-containing protein, partial [Bacteroidota bacterium]
MRYLFCFLSYLVIGILIGQDTALSGRISDQHTEMPLVGATIQLVGPDQQYGTVTDSNGYYRFTKVTPGRYDMLVTYIGYLPIKIPGQLLGSGPVTARN